MKTEVGDVAVHYVEHGEGAVVLVLHGAGVDHREAEACFEPALSAQGGLRRIYPDLPGMGLTQAPSRFRSADDVLATLVDFADQVAGQQPVLLVGHSAGAYFAQGFTALEPDRVSGLALICPLLTDVRDVPDHQPVVTASDLGDEEFRGYFVIQTPAMLERYERFVAPSGSLVDAAAMERIGERWRLTAPEDLPYERPTLIVAGRQDSTVGYAAAADLVSRFPRSTLAILDRAGHALPHEQPELLASLLRDWLSRIALPR